MVHNYYAALDCGVLSSPLNGNVTIIGGTVYPNGQAIYNCDIGYNLNGSMNRSCLVNGWSGDDPMCESKKRKSLSLSLSLSLMCMAF